MIPIYWMLIGAWLGIAIFFMALDEPSEKFKREYNDILESWPKKYLRYRFKLLAIIYVIFLMLLGFIVLLAWPALLIWDEISWQRCSRKLAQPRE